MKKICFIFYCLCRVIKLYFVKNSAFCRREKKALSMLLYKLFLFKLMYVFIFLSKLFLCKKCFYFKFSIKIRIIEKKYLLLKITTLPCRIGQKKKLKNIINLYHKLINYRKFNYYYQTNMAIARSFFVCLFEIITYHFEVKL